MSEALPIVSWDLYQLVWVTDWWDWELAGIAQRDGKRVFFTCIDAVGPADRLFAIYDPPINVWAKIDEEHADFQTHVGTHWDFGDDAPVTKRPHSEHHKFYDKYPKGSIKMQPEWQIAIADSRIEPPA